MKTEELLDQDVYFVFVSPEGVESEYHTPGEAERALNAGEFETKHIVDCIGYGPSTEFVYHTDVHKIDKVKRIAYKRILETEDVTEKVAEAGLNGTGFAI